MVRPDTSGHLCLGPRVGCVPSLARMHAPSRAYLAPPSCGHGLKGLGVLVFRRVAVSAEAVEAGTDRKTGGHKCVCGADCCVIGSAKQRGNLLLRLAKDTYEADKKIGSGHLCLLPTDKVPAPCVWAGRTQHYLVGGLVYKPRHSESPAYSQYRSLVRCSTSRTFP